MRPARIGHHSTYSRPRSPIPASLLCSKLGEKFELFSDRMEDAIEREALIDALVAMHNADISADDYR